MVRFWVDLLRLGYRLRDVVMNLFGDGKFDVTETPQPTNKYCLFGIVLTFVLCCLIIIKE